MLNKANCLLNSLNALLTSTSSTPSVSDLIKLDVRAEASALEGLAAPKMFKTHRRIHSGLKLSKKIRWNAASDKSCSKGKTANLESFGDTGCLFFKGSLTDSFTVYSHTFLSTFSLL